MSQGRLTSPHASAGHLNINGYKMSKSLKNFISIRFVSPASDAQAMRRMYEWQAL